MTTIRELINWLNDITLDPPREDGGCSLEDHIAINDDAMGLVVIEHPEIEIEIGAVPLEDEE